MRLDRTLLSGLCAVVSASPCYAERRNDDGTGTRDDSLWTETESRDSSRSGKSKCGISQSAGKIRIDSKKGKGGSAAYQSTWDVDWTDSFVMEFEHELKSGRPSKTSQSATSGIALGFGTFNRASGWTDGVNVVVTRTKTARTLTASVRVNDEVVETDTFILASGSGAHDFKLVWTSFGGTVSLDVQRGASTTPLVSLTGLETHFAGHVAEGMGVSLFGTSTGNFKFEASFDDVSFSGDDYNDPDDSSFDDDDGSDDADEDGDSNGDDSADAASFNAALDAIVSASDLPILEAEAEDDSQSGVSGVKALQWNDTDDTLVEVFANAEGVVRTRSWPINPGQLDKYEDSISVIGLVEMSATDAVSQAVASNPGSTVHAIELEEEDGRPMWQVELVTASGLELEVRIWAD